MTNMKSVEDLKEKIKIYQENNQFSTVGLKFTNRYQQEYEIQCYKKEKYYLRASQAQACISTPDIQNWMKNHSKAHQERRLAEGCAIGTAVHKLIENFIKSEFPDLLKATKDACEEEGIEVTLELSQQVGTAFQSFLKIWGKLNARAIATELTVHSDKLDCAGTIDLVAEINGKIHLIDYKSGSVANGVKVETSQSFYKYAFEEQFGVPVLVTILHLKRELNEKTGEPEGYHFTYNHYDMSFRSFLGALAVFQVHEWKNLKTFWPKWNDNLFHLEHRSF